MHFPFLSASEKLNVCGEQNCILQSESSAIYLIIILSKRVSVLKSISQIRGICMRGIIYGHLQGLGYVSDLFNSQPFLDTELTSVYRELEA